MSGSGTNGSVTCHDYNVFAPHSSSHLLPLSTHIFLLTIGNILIAAPCHSEVIWRVICRQKEWVWGNIIFGCCDAWCYIRWQRCQQTQLLDTQFETVRQQNTSSYYKLSNWPHFIWESLTQWLATWHMIHDQVASKGEKCKFWAWLLCNKLRVERSRKEKPHFGLYKDTELIKSCETVKWRSGPKSKRKENIDDQSWS